MTETGPGPPRRARPLEQVAQSYLGRSAVGPRVVVVAGFDPDPTGRTATLEAARRRLADLGIGPEALRLIDLGFLPRAAAGVVLPPRVRHGADCLLVCLPRVDAASRSVAYRLGLWAWSLSARHIRGLWSGTRPQANPVAAQLRERLVLAGSMVPLEILPVAAGWGGDLHAQLVSQVLLSTLNASSVASRVGGARALQGRG